MLLWVPSALGCSIEDPSTCSEGDCNNGCDVWVATNNYTSCADYPIEGLQDNPDCTNTTKPSFAKPGWELTQTEINSNCFLIIPLPEVNGFEIVSQSCKCPNCAVQTTTVVPGQISNPDFVNSSDTLSTGAIIGISVGAVAIVLAVAFVIRSRSTSRANIMTSSLIQ